MIDFDFPFTTWMKDSDDPTYLGTDEEIKLLFKRQQLIDKLCSTGFKEADVLFDMLAEHGIDPISYISSVNGAIQEIIHNRIPVENKEFFLGD